MAVEFNNKPQSASDITHDDNTFNATADTFLVAQEPLPVPDHPIPSGDNPNPQPLPPPPPAPQGE
jgi:hypothetical protein